MEPSPWSQPPQGLPPTPGVQGQPLPPPNPASAAPPVPSVPPTPTSTGIPAGAWVLLGAGLAAVLGALLPWVRASVGPITIERAGTDVDGAITLFLGVVLGALALLALVIGSRGARGLAMGIGALVASGLVLLIAIVDIADVTDKAGNIEADGIFVDVSVGSGLWLTLVAGLAGVLGGVLVLFRRR